MEDLLTVREVQDMLRVDRTTIYRMLRDGRLHGVKVGQQWRFPRGAVEGLLAAGQRDEPAEDSALPRYLGILPIHCIQPIQNILAQVVGVAIVTLAPDGTALTRMSNVTFFSDLIMATESGRRNHDAFLRSLAGLSGNQAGFITADTGVHYIAAPISLDNRTIGVLVAGQFYLALPDPSEEQARIARLGRIHNLNPATLAEAAREIPILDARARSQIGGWMKLAATTFETIGRERADLIGRLQQIADLTVISPRSGV